MNHPTHVIHKGQKLKVVGRFGHLQYLVEGNIAVPILECQTVTEKADPLADAAAKVETKTEHPLEQAQSEIEYKPMQHTPPPGLKEHKPAKATKKKK